MMDHLRLVERHIDAPVIMAPVRSVAAKCLFGELRSSAEMTAVVRHMEQRLKRNPPRILIAIRDARAAPGSTLALPDTAFACQVPIGAGEEQWRRQRVGIKKCEVVYAEKDSTLFYVNIVYFLNVE